MKSQTAVLCLILLTGATGALSAQQVRPLPGAYDRIELARRFPDPGAGAIPLRSAARSRACGEGGADVHATGSCAAGAHVVTAYAADSYMVHGALARIRDTRPWWRYPLVGAAVGAVAGAAAGGLVFATVEDPIADPVAVIAWGGVQGAGIGALIGGTVEWVVD